MKKFQFSLDTVLNYKEQVLDLAQNEHRQAIEAVAKQEAVLQAIRENYRASQTRLGEQEREGVTVNLLCQYAAYLDNLEKQAEAEEARLRALRAQEAEKREKVVEMMKEKTSIEKLRKKKSEEYHKEEQKQEEHFIEEFVSNARSMKATG